MVKLSHRQTEDPARSSVAAYVADMAAELKRELPEVDADEIVAETKAHLEDRVRDLAATGLSASEAAKAAIAGFGDSRSFGRSIGRSRLETQSSALAKTFGSIALAGLFSSVFVVSLTFEHVLSPSPFWHESWPKQCFTRDVESVTLAYAATSFFAVFGMLCSYFSRRRRTLPILFTGFMAIFAILSSLAYCGPGAPYLLENATAHNTHDIAITRQRIVALQNDLSRLPRFPIAGWPYKAPKPIQQSSAVSATSYVFEALASNTPDAENRARTAWRTYGPRWLLLENACLQRLQDRDATLPHWFDWRFVMQTKDLYPIWVWVIPFTAGIVALDWMASWAGRRTFLNRRRWRRKQQTA